MKQNENARLADQDAALVILGAGAPHRGDLPAALREPRAGTSILQWLLDASSCTMSQAIFVAGYQAEAIRARYPELSIVENPNWEQTGSGTSLLYAPLNASKPLLVSYGDILFRDAVPKALAAAEADIVVAYDSAWTHRYTGRSVEDLARCEKVIVNQDRVVRLGADIEVDWADGEFIGLVHFSPLAVERLAKLRETGPETLFRRQLSDYVEYLRGQGLSVAAVDVAGDWAEFNQPQDIAHFILGTKAETLGRLRGMVCNAVIQDQVSFTVSRWAADCDAILSEVRSRFGEHKLVVRSSARSEDSFHASNAGGYDSVLNVDPKNDLTQAIEKVIGSYGSAALDDQVLIQPMVTGVSLSGVAFTRTLEHGAPWYVINYEANGNTEAITSGASDDHRTLLVRRHSKLSSDALPEPRLSGLLDALREIEALLGYDSLDVEFAIDGQGQVHILQVRPIAVDRLRRANDDDACDAAILAARAQWEAALPAPPHLPGNAAPLFGVMPDWNPAEIIGTSPGALAASLYRYLIMDEVWATQRCEYGYRDVRPAPLLASFAGQPYVDVRASFASFLPATLPDDLAGRLLGFYLGWLRDRPELHDKVEFEVVPTCLAPGFEAWERRLRDAGGFTSEEVEQLREGLRSITANAFERCDADLGQIEQLSERFDAVMADERLQPLERARLLLDDCRRFGTLPFAHLARSGFVAMTLLREAASTGVISAEARESFLSTVQTVGHGLTADARAVVDGGLDWDSFVARYGHLRPGTYDVTSPRYDADPERFLRPLVAHAREAALDEVNPQRWHAERAAFFAALEEIGLPGDADLVERFLHQAIEGREYAKFVFSRNLSAALEALAEVGAAHGLDREAVSDLPLEELLVLRHTSRPKKVVSEHLHQRSTEERQARRVTMACELPPLLAAARDLDAFIIGSDRPNFVGSSAVTAQSIDLATHTSGSMPDIAGHIVLIPQADPGYDWLFGQGIVGLVTLYGGANSHMAIRAAEFGLPAAIGIGEQRYRQLAQARLIELSPGNGILRAVG